MDVTRTESGEVLIRLDIEQGSQLARLIRKHAQSTTSACLELASVLSEARYTAKNHFKQPPHAFDEKAPPAPKSEHQ